MANRKNKQKKLRSLIYDPLLSSYDRGWIKQEINAIERKSINKNGKIKKRIRLVPGKELCHFRGYEAAKGYCYMYSQLNLSANHRLQHKYDKNGKLNKKEAIKKSVINNKIRFIRKLFRR